VSDHRFAIIPGWVVTHPDLKGKMLQVICLLGRHTDKQGWCRRSQVKMSEEIGCARSTVQSALDSLIEIGAVERREVVSENGRDSAHWYRVIYDRDTPSHAFGAWDGDDAEEFDPNTAGVCGGTPAGIPAPPAGPEPAPPAGSGPAPINDPNITPPVEQEERERERENGEEEENPKVLERRFRKWWSGWPTYAVDAEAPTRRAWLDLTPEQRKACEERTPDYLAEAKRSGRKFSKAAATYLSERAWERLAERSSVPAAPETFNAYSRPWSALRLAELSKSPMPLMLDALEQRIIEAKPEKEEMIWRDKREKKGWPEAVKLHQAALDRKPVLVPELIVTISQGFDKVQVGGAVWEAWKRLHHQKCWPWLPEPQGLGFVQFPALDDGIEDLDEAVADALRRFQRQLIEARKDDDAA
jgi:Predicted transcriptional regulator